MDKRSSVTVRVFGQDYSILGDMSKEDIARCAELVDQKMQEIAASYKGSTTAVAVLAALNIATEVINNESTSKLLADISSQLSQTEKYNEVLSNRVEELTQQLETRKNVPAEAQKRIQELESKCRDIESSFFDIQMENIHLKNDLETLKRQQNPTT